MARIYKQPSLVSGMTVQDILNMDNTTFNKLTESEMRKVVGRLVSAGNKRLRSFERAGESSPATRHGEKSGGVFYFSRVYAVIGLIIANGIGKIPFSVAAAAVIFR